MNYIDINTFLTISSSKSLSKAAELLYVSQPALSHRLSSLEDELGTPLIVRHKGVRTIVLTDAGKRFIPIAEKWLMLWEETKKINLPTYLEPFNISNVDSLNLYFMPQVYTKFLKENTSCKLNIMTLRSNSAYRAIENHEVDLGFVTNAHFFKKIQTIPLFKEEMTFICNKNTTYNDTLTPLQLNAEDEIYIPWSNNFIMWHDYWFGTESKVKICLDNMTLLKEFLRIENAWAIVPSTVAHTLMEDDSLKTCTLLDSPEPRICYAIQDDMKNTLLTKAFIKTFIDTVKDLPEVEIIGEQYRD